MQAIFDRLPGGSWFEARRTAFMGLFAGALTMLMAGGLGSVMYTGQGISEDPVRLAPIYTDF